MSGVGDTETPPAIAEVQARPVVSALWCWGTAAVILAAFWTIAAVLRGTSDGVSFHLNDQLAIAGIGLALAGLAILPTRPRLIANSAGVWTRGVLGGFRMIPWSLVEAVEFRPKWRWARLVLPADETVSLYAVQRWDTARSVQTMRALRRLFDEAVEAEDQHQQPEI